MSTPPNVSNSIIIPARSIVPTITIKSKSESKQETATARKSGEDDIGRDQAPYMRHMSLLSVQNQSQTNPRTAVRQHSDEDEDPEQAAKNRIAAEEFYHKTHGGDARRHRMSSATSTRRFSGQSSHRRRRYSQRRTSSLTGAVCRVGRKFGKGNFGEVRVGESESIYHIIRQ